jgi:hypothetical protein
MALPTKPYDTIYYWYLRICYHAETHDHARDRAQPGDRSTALRVDTHQYSASVLKPPPRRTETVRMQNSQLGLLTTQQQQRLDDSNSWTLRHQARHSAWPDRLREFVTARFGSPEVADNIMKNGQQIVKRWVRPWVDAQASHVCGALWCHRCCTAVLVISKGLNEREVCLVVD